jgi:hypothetical protein
MYSYFTDLHVDLLTQALLQPGEQRLGQTATRYIPWWALGFVNKAYLVIATDQRIILIEHRMAWLHQSMKLHSVESIPWGGVEEARVTGLFNKKLRLRGRSHSGPLALKVGIPNTLFGLLAPMRNNVAGARAIANAFTASRALVAGPLAASLPSPQHAALPGLPAQNSPGYSSVAPVPQQQFGGPVPPMPSPPPLPRSTRS